MAEAGEDTAGAMPASRCDLIAMATHGRSGIARWALGSITERVLHGTQLPLVIARSAAAVKRTSPDVRSATQATTQTASHEPDTVDTPWQALF